MSEVHLVKAMHDVVMRPTELWCDDVEYEHEAGWPNRWTQSIGETTCRHCLREVARYGAEASARLQVVEAETP